jgi:ABC-type transport system involved in multi-copper enzyme maturation permease subunit
MRDRVQVVASATFREAVRDRVLLIIVAFAGLLILGSRVLGWLSIEDEIKMTKDFSLSGISVLVALLAMLVGAGSIAREVERRTVYTVLSRDCGRGEFVLGKFVGLVAVFWACIAGMALILFAWVLLWGGPGAIDVRMLAAVAGLACEAVVITAVSLFLGTLSAPALAAAGTLAFYVVGHSTEALRELTANGKNPDFAALFNMLYRVIPNLENVNFINATTSGRDVEWSALGLGAASVACWSLVFLAGAIALFRRRQF